MTKSWLMWAGCAAALTACSGGNEENPYTYSNTDDSGAPAAEQQANASATALPPGVKVSTKEGYGEYLTDGSGRSLYVLEGARQSGPGGGGTGCTGECLTQWPAFNGSGANPQGQGGSQASLAGWPLNYYVGDHNPGSTAGQQYKDKWGQWFLLSPRGEPIRGRETGPDAQ